LSFDGRCRAALTFYERCLGCKVVYMMTYAQSPSASTVPADWENRIYHATISFGGQTIGAADAAPGSYRTPQGFSLMLHVDEADEADRIFATLAENGVVQMPVQQTFWAARFGVLTDQFGTPWMIQCDGPTQA